MNSKVTYKPIAFYVITFLITWGCLFIAIYLSYQGKLGDSISRLFIAATFGPLIAALALHYQAKNHGLWKDFGNRLINFKLIKPSTLPILFFIMPLATVIAILISLLFGESINQFTITPGGSFSMGGASILFFTILVPIVEEVGWRGYGVDSIRSRFNLFKTSLIFGIIWALWHAPMFAVKGSYMNGLLSNWAYVVNYFISVIVVAFIFNWLFYKNNRSIIIASIMHIMANQTGEIFAVTKFTKCIGTVILIIFLIMIVAYDRKLFFNNNKLSTQS